LIIIEMKCRDLFAKVGLKTQSSYLSLSSS
jgi:hypothetical protein